MQQPPSDPVSPTLDAPPVATLHAVASLGGRLKSLVRRNWREMFPAAQGSPTVSRPVDEAPSPRLEPSLEHPLPLAAAGVPQLAGPPLGAAPNVSRLRTSPPARRKSHKRMTCGVCFGTFAVLKNGRMTDHGYGHSADACDGTHFEPLEVSNGGLRWLKGSLNTRRERAQAKLTEIRAAQAAQPDLRNIYLEAEQAALVAGLERQMLAVMQMLQQWTPKDPVPVAVPPAKGRGAVVLDLFAGYPIAAVEPQAEIA